MPRYLQQAFAFGCEPLLHSVLVTAEALQDDFSQAAAGSRIVVVGTDLRTCGELGAIVACVVEEEAVVVVVEEEVVD